MSTSGAKLIMKTDSTKKFQAKRSQAYYSLSVVKQLVKQGDVDIRGNALESAYQDFGWKTDDILDAIRKLKPAHYYKSEPSRMRKSLFIDYYKAPELKGEAVYIHFYIVDGRLIVNSFKRI